MAARRKLSTSKTAEPKVPKAQSLAGGDTYVEKAAGFKKGGKVGGNLPMHGAAAQKNLGRPGRKRGGGVGADSSPLTSAANLSQPGAIDKHPYKKGIDNS